MLAGLIVAVVVSVVAVVGAVLAHGRPIMDNSACHAAPKKPYTPADARVVWQVRAQCDSRFCADAAAALDALIEAGEVIPKREYQQWVS